MTYYKYKVTTVNCEYDELTDEGVVRAKSYADAAHKIAEDYGEKSIIELFIQDLVIECHCINKEEFESAFRE